MFKIYCSNCGLKIDPEDLFCSKCGKKLKTEFNLQEIKQYIPECIDFQHSNISKSIAGNYKAESGKYSPQKTFFMVLVLIFIFGCIISIYLTSFFNTSYIKSESSPGLYCTIDKEKNIQICKQIASEYYKTHEYSNDDIYDCDNMAQDIWNMLKARGINARIAVGDFKPENRNGIKGEEHLNNNLNSEEPGNFEEIGQISNLSYLSPCSGNLDSQKIDNLTHAWVLAEVSPDYWLAIESTGGYVVYSTENESYYHGLIFSNPKNYRIFFELYRDWKTQAAEYKSESLSYNKLIGIFNNASYSEQMVMKSSIEITKERLHEKEEKFLKTDSELKALLQYG